MDNLKLTEGIINLLQYLLPGFFAAWVFYGFTSFPKPSQFERIVQALIFTLIIQSVVFVEEITALKIGTFYSCGIWSKESGLFCSSITAIFLGFTFAYFANNDQIHTWFRDHKIFDKPITRESSYPSEWFGTFIKPENLTYVVLHMEGERRLYGWPLEWPSESDKGHFVIAQPSWLEWNGEMPIERVSSIMVNVKDVKWVEFIDKSTWEDNSNV